MRWLTTCFITCFFLQINAQSFTALTDKATIAANEYIQVEFVLENAQGNNFTPPDFKDWTILQGPSTSTQVSIINGTRSSKMSYSYLLSPKTMGNLTIGKASMVVNKKTLTTNPITIKVSKEREQVNTTNKNVKGLTKQDLFIIAKATPASAYTGQQVLIEYKLYTAVDIDNYNIVHSPEFKGFHVNNIPRLGYDQRETLHGRNYVSKIISSYSVYPMQSGQFEIEPMHVRAGVIVDDGGNNSSSFFFLPTTEGVNLMSNAVQINVKELPQPTPEGFTGAVGRFSMASNIDQLTVKTNDALSITLYLEGDGDLNRIGNPYLQIDSSAFQLYEPKITKENMDYKTSGFIGMREWVFPLVAMKPGNQKIIPSFTYFNPDSQKYLILAPEVFNVAVSGQEMTHLKKQESSPTLEKDTLTLIKNPSLATNRFGQHPLVFLGILLPLMTWLGSVLYIRKKNKADQSSLQLKKWHQLKLHSLHELTSLHSSEVYSEKNKMDGAFDILQSYLRKKWTLPDQSLSKDQWNSFIELYAIDPVTRSQLKALFEEAELALYAGQLSKEQVNQFISNITLQIEAV